MDRQRWLGSRAVVLLVTVVAVLSFTVGIANIIGSQGGLIGDLLGVQQGILSAYLPEGIERTAGFTGAMTGFLMLFSVLGLRRGLRAAWYSTVVLLPVTALQGLVQGSTVSLPLVGLSVLSMPLVVWNRRRFRQRWSMTTSQLAALGALAGAQIYGTTGTYALRDEFNGVETVLDAFYYTLVTASTVGYGDISAMATSQIGRLFSMTVLVIGVASFGLAAGTLLGPAIEARFAAALGNMTDSQLNMLENHIIVLGYGELTEPILEELMENDIPFVVITPDSDRASVLRNRDINVLTAEPSDEEPLHDAGIERAAGVVAATNNDAEDALSILTARELNPDIRIVAAATERENSRKLKRAGANTVISPAVIGGHLLVQSALGKGGMEGVADQLIGMSGETAKKVAENIDNTEISEPAAESADGDADPEDVDAQ